MKGLWKLQYKTRFFTILHVNLIDFDTVLRDYYVQQIRGNFDSIVI